MRLTQRDEYGNAEIIALSDTMPVLYDGLSFSETNCLTAALNKLAIYEDMDEYRYHFGQEVDGNAEMWIDGFLRIIHNGKFSETIIGAEDGAITLNDLLAEIEYHDGVVYVWIDDAMHGDIFMYGNHGDRWEYYGKTMGYA